MSRIHTGLKSAKFENPGAITTATICSTTGKKATTGCPNTYTEYFLWFTAPEVCDEHSGSEIKNNKNIDTTTNTITEIIKGITDDIDVKEPERINNSVIQNENSTNTNTHTNTPHQATNNTINPNTPNTTTNTNRNTSTQSNITNTNTNTSTNTNSNTEKTNNIYNIQNEAP